MPCPFRGRVSSTITRCDGVFFSLEESFRGLGPIRWFAVRQCSTLSNLRLYDQFATFPFDVDANHITWQETKQQPLNLSKVLHLVLINGRNPVDDQ